MAMTLLKSMMGSSQSPGGEERDNRYRPVSNLEHLISVMPIDITAFLGANEFKKISAVSKHTNNVITNPVFQIQERRCRSAFEGLYSLIGVKTIPTKIRGKLGLSIYVSCEIDICEIMKYVLELGSELHYLYIREGENELNEVNPRWTLEGMITGNIPKEIGLLSNLEYLRIEGHMVSHIPKSMANMTELKYLSLSTNVILGSIPEEFFDSSNSILKSKFTEVDIWQRARNGRKHTHRGDICNMPTLDRTTTWGLDDVSDENTDTTNYFNYFKMPLLLRSNGIVHRSLGEKLPNYMERWVLMYHEWMGRNGLNK